MTSIGTQRGYRFEDCALGISAHRVWEHIQLRQINPFAGITPDSALKPQNYVDIVDLSGPVAILTGLTLSDLMQGKHRSLSHERVKKLLTNAENPTVQKSLGKLEDYLYQFSEQHIVRNMPKPFLTEDKSNPLGIQGLHCALLTWIDRHRSEKAGREQWLHRIKNLTKKGLRAEELKFSCLEENLATETSKSVRGNTLIKSLTYKGLELSILPMVYKAESHLTFLKVPPDAVIKRIKPKLKAGLVTHPQWRDRAMGYWIDTVDWDDLLGRQRRWMAFTHRGQPIVSHDKPTGLCETHEEAWELANNHAEQAFPKMTARGQYARFRLTGGEQYREWLITLPLYGPSYFSEHYDHRNILIHVRCDIREDADGGRVLMLQEVQSDWAQEARRSLKDNNDPSQEIPTPPWLQEWPALALKLMLLHAAQMGVTALAWTQGYLQVKRYNGIGKNGLLELYDRTLPSEMTRIIKPYGKKCENIDVYLPVNFYIEPADTGYTVKDEDGNLLGTAPTWEEAQSLLPDGAHDMLGSMHGIRLEETLRKEILKNGFSAWGAGIQ